MTLPAFIPQALLARLDSASASLIESLSARPGDVVPNVAMSWVNGQRFITRVNDVYVYQIPEFLLLLGCSQLLGVANALCGNDAVPVYESLMIRTVGDETFTAVHQGMVYDRFSRIATFCLYLDSAGPGDGSVRVVPGSQRQKHDLNRFDELYRNNRWAWHDLKAEPGDLLIHDVMAIHDSPPLKERKRRRTIYMEFRSANCLKNGLNCPDEWLANRKTLVAMAKRKYAAFSNGEDYSLSEQERLFCSGLYRTAFRIEPANYAVDA